jgi:hypothetical protein
MANSGILLGLQSDAVSNQYSLTLPAGIPGAPGANIVEISLRQDQVFATPKREMSTYMTWYQGQKIERRGFVENTEKKFTIAWRLDEDWNVFSSMLAWFKKCYDDYYGTGDIEANCRVPMVYQQFGANKVLKHTQTYHGVCLVGIKPSDNNHEEAAAMRIECDYIYAWTTP